MSLTKATYFMIAGAPVNVQDFGAVGDGTTDDTAAIQAAIDATFSLNGGCLVFPKGTYKITASLNIALYAGWTIQGYDRLGTKIVQATDNTPIFRFTKENINRWTIQDLNLEWASNQPATNTLAVAIYIDCDTAVGSGVYHGIIQRMSWDKGFRGISTSDTRNNYLWGTKFQDIEHRSNMTGAFLRIAPASGGSPNNTVDNIYIRGDSSTEPYIILRACSALQINSVEVNVDINGQTIVLCEAGCSGDISQIRTESGVYSTDKGCLLNISDSEMTVGSLVLSTTEFDVSGGDYFLIKLGGSITYVNVGVVYLGNQITVTAGNVYVVTGGSVATRTTLIQRIQGLSEITALSDVDNTDTTVAVLDWALPKASANNGDADKTLAMGDAEVQFFSTTLTGNRTVSLPRRYNPTNVYNGARFRIVRNANTPGAFTLTINAVDQPTIATIPINARASVDLIYRRNEWIVDNYVTLP